MALTLDEVRTAPIFIVIVLILINGFVNHLIYKDSVIFLFEKGMTNRQRREWRKERYFKRKTMRYIRGKIKSLPQQKFSPNIEPIAKTKTPTIIVSHFFLPLFFLIVSTTATITARENNSMITLSIILQP